MGQHTRGPGTARLDRGNDSPMYRYPLGSARKVKGVSHAIRLGVGGLIYSEPSPSFTSQRGNQEESKQIAKL
jgi:hypothetical protein